MAMTKATNFKMIRTSPYSNYVLSCEIEGARYHIWLDSDSRELSDATLYKNSIADRGQPGHHECRRLRTDTIFNSRLVKDMLDFAKANDLFKKADEEIAAKEAKERAAGREQWRIKTIKEAGVELLEALELYVAAVGNTAAVVDRPTLQLAWDKAQAAMKLAKELKVS